MMIRFWPGAEDRGQPTVFNATKQGEEFTVDWSGEVLYWTLGITSTENQFHQLCKPARPKPNRYARGGFNINILFFFVVLIICCQSVNCIEST